MKEIIKGGDKTWSIDQNTSLAMLAQLACLKDCKPHRKLNRTPDLLTLRLTLELGAGVRSADRNTSTQRNRREAAADRLLFCRLPASNKDAFM